MVGVWNVNPSLSALKKYQLVEMHSVGKYKLTQKGLEWYQRLLPPALNKATRVRNRVPRSSQSNSSLKEELLAMLTELEKILRASKLLLDVSK